MRLPDGHDAEHVQQAVIRKMRVLPKLLRQYFPKGTDLDAYGEAYLDAVAEEPDDRPRKTLDWMKPSEKILELTDSN